MKNNNDADLVNQLINELNDDAKEEIPNFEKEAKKEEEEIIVRRVRKPKKRIIRRS